MVAVGVKAQMIWGERSSRRRESLQGYCVGKHKLIFPGKHRLILGKRFAHAEGDGEVVGVVKLAVDNVLNIEYRRYTGKQNYVPDTE